MTYHAYALTESKTFHLVCSSTALGDSREDLVHIAVRHGACLIWINGQFYFVGLEVQPMSLGDHIFGIPWTTELENKLLNMVKE